MYSASVFLLSVFSLLQVFSLVPFHFALILQATRTAGTSSERTDAALSSTARPSYLRVLKPVISQCRKFIAVNHFPTTSVLGVATCSEPHSFLDSRTMFALV